MSGQNAEVLDYLREQFARMDGRFDRIERTLKEHTDRFFRLENNDVQTRRDTAEFYAHLVGLTHQIEGVGVRLDRIGRRLDLVDHP